MQDVGDRVMLQHHVQCQLYKLHNFYNLKDITRQLDKFNAKWKESQPGPSKVV